MRLPHRLGRELDAWHRDGLISDDQRRAILARYEPAASASAQVSNTLITLAILAAGTGVVSLLAWNWSAIPPLVKAGGAIALVAASYAAAAMKARAGKGAHAERLAFFGALLSGGALFVGAEVVRSDPERTGILLLWSVVLASTAWLTPSALCARRRHVRARLVDAGHGRFAAGAVGVPPRVPMLAAAVERVENRVAAGGVAIAFGCWRSFWLTLGSHQMSVPADVAARAKPLDVVRGPNRPPAAVGRPPIQARSRSFGFCRRAARCSPASSWTASGSSSREPLVSPFSHYSVAA